jgi:N-acetyl-anhydromuramyl-L-alanine amidase AmpD
MLDPLLLPLSQEFFKIGIIGHILDALLGWADLVVSRHNGNGAKFPWRDYRE